MKRTRRQPLTQLSGSKPSTVVVLLKILQHPQEEVIKKTPSFLIEDCNSNIYFAGASPLPEAL
jgi:hypothetical protein